MKEYQAKIQEFFEDFGKGKTMVLSTADGDRVSSRMMSVVLIDGRFYFQTDVELRKYKQLKVNEHVALCIDNIQIEGICEEKGHPMEDPAFCETFRDCFKGSFDAYTSLKNERLFVVRPVFIERWIYKNGKPYVERFDLEKQGYSFDEYSGV